MKKNLSLGSLLLVADQTVIETFREYKSKNGQIRSKCSLKDLDQSTKENGTIFAWGWYRCIAKYNLADRIP